MKVCKFGGSSLADAERVRQVCGIVAADPARRVVVVSAPGKRDADDTKVTDLLIACAERKLAGEPASGLLEQVTGRFAEIQRGLDLPDDVMQTIAADLARRLEGDVGRAAQFMDSMKAAGEDNCARLVAAALCGAGTEAHYVDPRDAGLWLTEEYGNARLLPQTYENLAALADAPGVTVFPGFFGYTPDGAVVTFSRGGSDITGSILAAALKAEVYENFTDVDCVYAADPRVIPEVRPIADLTYREMRELSYAGFGVLHDEAIIPAVHAGIPICIRSTANPDAAGTHITLERTHTPGEVVGIACDAGFCTIYVSKYLMNREVGFGRRLLQVFEEEGLSYEHVPSGIDNVSIILREEGMDGKAERRILDRIRNELGADDVDIEHGLALIMIVGEGMRYAVGLAARATRALADARVNIEMMNQGSSEISMMFGVKEVDSRKAVRSLYEAFFHCGGR